MGIGVTARSRDDAIDLIAEVQTRCPIEPVDFDAAVENVDLSTLDPSYVLSNIGDWTQRGIWFPRVAMEPENAQCPHCGFSLAGTLQRGLRRCPECGGGFDLARLCGTDGWDRVMLIGSVIVLSVVGLPLFLIMVILVMALLFR